MPKSPNIFENLRKKKQGNNFDAEADVKNSSKTEELKVLCFFFKNCCRQYLLIG